MSILIISKKANPATDEVIDWLSYYDKYFFRVSVEDFIEAFRFTYSLFDNDFKLTLNLKNKINRVEIKSGWFREDSQFDLGEQPALEKEMASFIEKHLKGEFDEFKSGVLNPNSSGIKWLCGYNKLNKIEVLAKASAIGLNVPETLITNNKEDLAAFLEKSGRIICKAVLDSFSVKSKEYGIYFQYTSEVKKSDLDMVPNAFFPSLFQRLIEKTIDVRVIFLNGKIFSAGIFSQKCNSTLTDYRNYNHEKRNRVVPINLPGEQKKMINRLMLDVNLNFGCLDLIIGQDGKIYFLEINPLGQFGMISYLCNFYIEEKIAKFLQYE